MVPGFEGIFHTKWIRRIKLVDRYYMNYNDYGHLDQEHHEAALAYQIGPKSVITFPSGSQQLPGRGFYEISGLAWSGGGAIRKVEVSTDGGKTLEGRGDQGNGTAHGVHPVRPSLELGRHRDRHHVALHGRTRFGAADRAPRSPRTSTSRWTRHSASRVWTTPFMPWHIASDGSVHQWATTLRALVIGGAHGRPPRWRRGPRSAWDARRARKKSAPWTSPSVRPVTSSRRGAEAPKRARRLYRTKCQACHGAGGFGGTAPILKSKMGPETDTWQRGRVLPVRAPFATIVWDYINRGMPLNREGTLTADEVYALTAYLLSINQVIPEDQVLDRESLPKVKMPLGEGEYAALPDWKPKTRRLKDYPF